MNKSTNLFILILFIGLFFQCKPNQSNSSVVSTPTKEIEFKIKPSATDSTIKAADIPHLIMYDASNQQGKLFLFLPGTNGIPEKGPKKLFRTAIENGYQVINLSYINQPAVARICKGENLANDIDCTEKFRTQRVFGTRTTSLIPDEPQDAIVHRFTKLLIYLNEYDKNGNWDKYLDNGSVDWNLITVAGQSQGGGMAAFIAQQKLENRIITFSGGWDYSEREPEKKIAKWYFNKSVTPPNRWFGLYHSQEPQALILGETYKALAIPENQIHPLDLEVSGKRAHVEGVRNILYKDLWKQVLGNGKLNSN